MKRWKKYEVLFGLAFLGAVWVFWTCSTLLKQAVAPIPEEVRTLSEDEELLDFEDQFEVIDEEKFKNGYTDMKDPSFNLFVRTTWIEERPGDPVELKDNRTDYSQCGQAQMVDNLLKKRTHGFFVEAGAATGEKLSNTFFFERERQWTGLLVEPNPNTFKILQRNQRDAYTSNVCLGTNGKTEILKFKVSAVKGRVAEADEDGDVKVQCIPLFGLLQALDITHVDYLSLDIEGQELEVLQSIPFDEVTIDVLTIEYWLKNDPEGTLRKLNKLRDFFNRLGNYKEMGVLVNTKEWLEEKNQTLKEMNALDVVFQRKSR